MSGKSSIVAALVGSLALAGCGASSHRGEGCDNCVRWQESQAPYLKDLAAQDKVLKTLSDEIREQRNVVAAAGQDSVAKAKLVDLEARREREEAVRMDIKKSADQRSDNFRADQVTGAVRKLDGKDPR